MDLRVLPARGPGVVQGLRRIQGSDGEPVQASEGFRTKASCGPGSGWGQLSVISSQNRGWAQETTHSAWMTLEKEKTPPPQKKLP